MTNFRTLRAWALACALLLGATGEAAAQCAGFSDIATADGFCPNVQWLKNRAVTLGCTASTYCPGDPVSRLAMAAFMNRLGTALTPTILPLIAVDAAVSLASPLVSCATGDYTVATFPQRAYIHATGDFYNTSGTIVVNTEIVYSINAGATWVTVPGGSGKSQVPLNADATISTYGVLDLVPAQSVRFGLRSSRSSGTAEPRLYCVVQAEIGNRNGTSPPY